jgi:hypothetical protein
LGNIIHNQKIRPITNSHGCIETKNDTIQTIYHLLEDAGEIINYLSPDPPTKLFQKIELKIKIIITEIYATFQHNSSEDNDTYLISIKKLIKMVFCGN